MSRKNQPKKAAASVLVTNSTAAAAPAGLVAMPTVNRKLVSIRKATLNGKDYKVVPMVMINEGVHAGSNGPLYYPKDELAKTPATWNHKPVTIRHPFDASGGRSACDADMLEKFSVGVIMNAKFDKSGARVTAEAWIDPERLKVVEGGEKVADAMANNKVLELSTGLFTDNEEKSGDHEGTPYDTIARNYRADHLAILPDEKGACSVSKGAGFIRNQLAKRLEDESFSENRVNEIVEAAVALRTKESKLKLNAAAPEMSYDQIRSAICDKLRERLTPKGATCPPSYPYIVDLYPDYCVYCVGCSDDYFKQSYTVDATTQEATLVGDAVPVVRDSGGK